MKQSKRDHEWRVRQLYPEWPPEVILHSRSVVQFDQADFERARWVWQRRPKGPFSAMFWRWLACILAPLMAAPFLPPPFGDVLCLASLIVGCVLTFLSNRKIDEWARWRSDYSRAIDRLISHHS